MHIIFPDCKYSESLARAGLPTLYARRELLCLDIFDNFTKDPKHKLNELLPPRAFVQQNRELRSKRVFNTPICKTNRYRNS